MSGFLTTSGVSASVDVRPKPEPESVVLPKIVTRDGMFGKLDEATEKLVRPQCYFAVTKCGMCSDDDCTTITSCCGWTLCKDCLDEEGVEVCFNCGDALDGIIDNYSHETTKNAFFKGCEPRHLLNTGRRPLTVACAFIDIYAKSRPVYALPKAYQIDYSLMVEIPKHEWNKIYFANRPKCELVFGKFKCM